MKITCSHGYFIFDPKYSSEVSEFTSWYQKTIVMVGDHYTFEELAEAPDYSIQGAPYLGVPATATFEGRPWDVMRANGLIYDFSLGTLRPITSIANVVDPIIMSDRYKDDGLYLPGSVLKKAKQKITGYTCFTDFEMFNFNYAEFYFD